MRAPPPPAPVEAGVERAKAAAARAAVGHIRPGMRLALGTGTTAAHAVRALAERFPDGAGISCVASSAATERLARELGVPFGPLEGDLEFDLMIDGADEVTPALDLTKGAGGALLREKFLARLSRELLIIVDPSKLVPRLGSRSPIPVEVVPFTRPVLLARLAARGLGPTLRREGAEGPPYRTDNGNELLDLRPERPIDDPRALDHELQDLPGVVETGLFVAMAPRVLVGEADGTVRELAPPGARRA